MLAKHSKGMDMVIGGKKLVGIQFVENCKD
jgi:hypothetical protein